MERYGTAANLYDLGMLAIWVREALKHANMSGAELSRRLSERLNRSIDRAAVQKMQMIESTGKTKPRQISADELFAISEITGYPVPDDIIGQSPIVFGDVTAKELLAGIERVFATDHELGLLLADQIKPVLKIHEQRLQARDKDRGDLGQ